MRKKLFTFGFFFAWTILLSGCLSYSRGYCESAEFRPKQLDESQKFPITYSINYIQADAVEHPLNGDDELDFRESLKESLLATGLFSSVQYETSATEDSYHIEFRIWRSGTDSNTAQGAAAICGSTLFLIPVGMDETIDASANIVLRNKTIASFGKAESVRTVYWLPFLPVCISPIITHNYVDFKIVDTLVNEVAQFHYKQFVLGANK